jgi:ATP-dependent DNA helicase RecG
MREEPVDTIPLIGPKQKKYLEQLDILNIRDLLFHIPYKYKDTSNIIPIEQLKQEREGTILAEVLSIKNTWTRFRKVITKATVADDTDKINIVWFNQSFLTKNIKPGETFLFEGKLSKKGNDFSNPAYEKFSTNQTHLGKITPFYPKTAGITSKWLRSRINCLKPSIDKIVEDKIPQEILEKYNLINLKEAIERTHFAKDFDEIELARKRLAFDEMLNISLQIEERKKTRRKRKAFKIETHEKQLNDFISSLSFDLTKDQKKATDEILRDMKKTIPMNRLLNGDVGSGKTIVAGICAYNAFLSGYSTVIMVPTTILAKQHYKTFCDLLEKLNVKIQLRISKKEIEDCKEPQVIIGTHALLFNTDIPKNTGLVVVDEQHRFGVKQRTKINENKAHYLTMTATPIPRTLTSIIYGDMGISLIIEKPKDRIPVETKFITSEKRDDCYKAIERKIRNSKFTEQAFIIFPLIDDSEKIDAKSATAEYEKISKTWFKDIKTSLLHGKIKENEKNKILEDFKNKKIHALFATSVIEVGIDFPDATMMIIESAERFGLAQLHQFRGRIGRGEKQSYCFIIANNLTENSKRRLKYFSKNNSGFDVAEYDLKSRGPGEVYGLRQTGIPILKVADITDFDLLNNTRKVAAYLDKLGITKEVKDNLFY